MALKLFVGGLPFATTDDELRELFAKHGDIVSARVVTDRETGRSRGFGFVEFAEEAAGKAAQEALNGTELGGRTIKVDIAQAREERPRRDFSSDRSGGDGGFQQRSF